MRGVASEGDLLPVTVLFIIVIRTFICCTNRLLIYYCRRALKGLQGVEIVGDEFSPVVQIRRKLGDEQKEQLYFARVRSQMLEVPFFFAFLCFRADTVV